MIHLLTLFSGNLLLANSDPENDLFFFLITILALIIGWLIVSSLQYLMTKAFLFISGATGTFLFFGEVTSVHLDTPNEVGILLVAAIIGGVMMTYIFSHK
ncbi:MAG: hypothetical protein AAFY48_11710 [Bacteroidota bacterium]